VRLAPVAATKPIVAAGALICRRGKRGAEVLLVHRRRYDDWSFPKGKLDPGEHLLAAAIREVREETGLTVRLATPLPTVRYTVSRNGAGSPKEVYYWVARASGDDTVDAFVPNAEIDEVAWASTDQARRRLTYPYDVDLLESVNPIAGKTSPLMIVRHAAAMKRSDFEGPDTRRPLRSQGQRQARRLVGCLSAYGIVDVISSDATRCVRTVKPYARSAGLEISKDPIWSEECEDRRHLRRKVTGLLDSKSPTALCTHRPVLPMVFEALGIDPGGRLMPGEFVVIHRHKGRVIATERHTS
jgi:8-oxo-dGTP pyrophosphatase MutT (NUDIX family)/phosphohistidine phosphatase SixA